MKKVLLLTPQSINLRRQKAVVDGFAALGYEAVPYANQRALAGVYDFAVCGGLRNHTLPARRAVVSAGIPMVIVELGYLKRAFNNGDTEGYFQLGLGRIGWVPPHPQPSDRWEALGLTLRPLRPESSSAPVLLAGQVGFDGQHNLSTHQLSEWLTKTAEKLPGPYVYRPHPQQPNTNPPRLPRVTVDAPSRVPLSVALDNCRLVVTFNSTTGIDAMLAGRRVISDPWAHYHAAGLSEDEQERLSYMHRLAYAQWKLPEIESGEALEFLIRQTGNTSPAGVI